MRIEINRIGIQRTMIKWAKECDILDVLYVIRKRKLYVYTTRPGVMIGRHGDCFCRYRDELKRYGIYRIIMNEAKNVIFNVNEYI